MRGGGVEDLAELNRRVVGDLELHCYHRRSAFAHERRGSAREHVRGRALSGLARIQYGEAQRLVITEQPGEVDRGEFARVPVLTGQVDDAGALALVEATVTDEVEYVPRPIPQLLLETFPALSLHPMQLDESVLAESVQGHIE